MAGRSSAHPPPFSHPPPVPPSHNNSGASVTRPPKEGMYMTVNALQFQCTILQELKRIMDSVRQILLEIKSAQHDLIAYVAKIRTELSTGGTSLASAIDTSTNRTLDGLASFMTTLRTDASMDEANKELKTVSSNDFMHCTDFPIFSIDASRES